MQNNHRHGRPGTRSSSSARKTRINVFMSFFVLCNTSSKKQEEEDRQKVCKTSPNTSIISVSMHHRDRHSWFLAVAQGVVLGQAPRRRRSYTHDLTPSSNLLAGATKKDERSNKTQKIKGIRSNNWSLAVVKSHHAISFVWHHHQGMTTMMMRLEEAPQHSHTLSCLHEYHHLSPVDDF